MLSTVPGVFERGGWRTLEPPLPKDRLLASRGVETRRAVLVIADIGGYTNYMQFHRSILAHAEATTTRLLAKVVNAARDFDLVEIEGDAAFLSRKTDSLDDGATLAAVTRAAVAMHRAFHMERELVQKHMCPCGSCTQTSELKLKFVAHVGEVANQTIRGRRNLVGMDVIFVHRLLKNPVPVAEYVLFSEELYRSVGASQPDEPMRELSHDLDGIGPVRIDFLDVGDLAGSLPPAPDPSWFRRFGATVGIVGRGLPYMLRLRHPRPTLAVAASAANGAS